MSVLGGFLPASYIEELEKLQDAVSPRPFEQVLVRLQEVLGADALNHFREIEHVPVGSASLAQVHRAWTLDGDMVAVKILYPGIEKLVKQDLRVIGIVVRVVQWVFGFHRAGSVVAQLASMLEHEMDYERERRNIERVRAMFSDRDDLCVPRVYEELSGKSVLVMSFESGTKITDLEAMARLGIDPVAVADTLTDCYMRMLFEHRVFHADPHPGNLLVREGNQVVLLDYGAVEDIRAELVSGIKKIMIGGLTRNPESVLAGLEEMGFIAEGGDRELLERVGREYLSALGELNVTNFSKLAPGEVRRMTGFDHLRGRLRRVAGSVQYPDGYFYVERTLALLFGLIGQLSPEKGLLGVAAPYASRAVMRGFARKQSQPADA